jgi:hypothetical protein
LGFFTYKKSKDVEHPLRFPLQVPPLGSAELIPRQKFTFEYFFIYKKSKDVEHPLRFPLQVHPSGLSGANPVSFSAGFLKNLIKTL